MQYFLKVNDWTYDKLQNRSFKCVVPHEDQKLKMASATVKINKVYHFDKINQFSEREIPEQSVSPGSDPKLYDSCDVISIIQKT